MTPERKQEIEKTVAEWKREADKGSYSDPGYVFRLNAFAVIPLIER